MDVDFVIAFQCFVRLCRFMLIHTIEVPFHYTPEASFFFFYSFSKRPAKKF